MSHLLAGKSALVLGVANRWSLAFSIAQAFLREGAHVTLTYQTERLKAAVEDLGVELGAQQVLRCDVTREEEMAELVAALKKQPGKLDALVHSIAFANREDLTRPFLETSREGFLLAHEVSAYSLVSVARAVAPLMDQGGSVMALTYLGSVRAVPNYNVMGVAKAALESCVRYLASELGSRGIRVNALSPGPVKTASARAIKDFSSILEVVAERAPLRRNTEPGEVADAAVFLASDLSRGVTGDILYLDAGYHIMGF